MYIIGNGFDRHHGVYSGYDSFSRWLKCHDREIYEVYRAVCSYKALWGDFETSMAYVRRDYFLDFAEGFMPDPNKDPDDLQAADIFLAGDWGASLAEQLVERLKKDFHRWVKSIKPNAEYDSKMIDLVPEAKYLTFNYTMFLEEKYGISPNMVKHIHGVKTDPKGTIIVGHGEDNDEIFDRWLRYIKRPIKFTDKKGKTRYRPHRLKKFYFGGTSELPEYEHITERIWSYYEDAQKPVKQIIDVNEPYFHSLSDVGTIYVLGFSFSKVDSPYIAKIIETNRNRDAIKWIVSYYDDVKDKKRALNCLLPLGVNEANIEFKTLESMQRNAN